MKRTARLLAGLSLALLLGCGSQTGTSAPAIDTTAPAATSAVGTAEPVSTGEATMTAADLEAAKQVVLAFAENVRSGRYAEIEPLMTDMLRDAFVQGAGSVEAGFRQGDERDGRIVAYTIGEARAVGTNGASVDIELQSERRTTSNVIELVNENGTWKIANIALR